MMPSGKKGEYSRATLESQYVYRNIIRPAVHLFAKNNNKNIKTLLEIEDHFTGSVAKSIIKHIAEAEICIVDITGHNPNVFFEQGVRYSLRSKTTILLKQNSDINPEIIPFDIQGYRCMTYDCLEPFEAIKKLYGFLLSSDKDSFKTDSLVFEVFKDMEVRIPNIITSTGESSDHLSWNELWKHIQILAKQLEELHRQHDIHVILGITNGGLIVADLIGRIAFRDIPILALWADRRSRATFKDDVDRSCYFFDNEYNKAILKSK